MAPSPCPLPRPKRGRGWPKAGRGGSSSWPRCMRKSEKRLFMSNPKFDVAVARIRCRRFRKRILDISQTVGALHIAPAFSCLELVDTAYFGLMRRTGDPETDDTFILSKGHGSLAQFVVLEELGIITPEQKNHYCKP